MPRKCHEDLSGNFGSSDTKAKPPANNGKDLVAPAGFEPATHGLGNRVIYEEEEDEEEEP